MADAQRAEWAARLKQEKQHAKAEARKEFEVYDHSNVAQQMMHSGGGHQHVYGGQMSSRPHEQQLVQAWRPSPDGTWQLGNGVIHRVHHEDDTVTVQFLPDQHRCRLPLASVKPQLDITPVYPSIRLAPGERVPTRGEIEIREHNANIRRQSEGLAPDAKLDADDQALLPGEHTDKNGMPVVYSDNWCMPSTTLDALRNRAIPFNQVKGYYQEHFYTNLYKNNFYKQTGASVSQSGHVGETSEHRHGSLNHNLPPKPKVVSHKYIPLRGAPLEQDLATGEWRAAHTGVGSFLEGPGLLG